MIQGFFISLRFAVLSCLLGSLLMVGLLGPTSRKICEMFQPLPVSLGIKSARLSERKKVGHQERAMVKGMARVAAKGDAKADAKK